MLPLKIKMCTRVQKLDAECNVDHTSMEAKKSVQTDSSMCVCDKKGESGVSVPPRSLFECTDLERKHMDLSLFI